MASSPAVYGDNDRLPRDGGDGLGALNRAERAWVLGTLELRLADRVFADHLAWGRLLRRLERQRLRGRSPHPPIRWVYRSGAKITSSAARVGTRCTSATTRAGCSRSPRLPAASASRSPSTGGSTGRPRSPPEGLRSVLGRQFADGLLPQRRPPLDDSHERLRLLVAGRLAGRVYFGAYNGVFYGASAGSGRVLWRVLDRRRHLGSGRDRGDGVAYVGSFYAPHHRRKPPHRAPARNVPARPVRPRLGERGAAAVQRLLAHLRGRAPPLALIAS